MPLDPQFKAMIFSLETVVDIKLHVVVWYEKAVSDYDPQSAQEATERNATPTGWEEH